MEVALPTSVARFGQDAGRRLALVCAVGAGCAAVGVSAAVAAANADESPGLVAAVRALITAAPIATGLYAWYRRVDARFGLLLAFTGAAWFVSTLAESGDEGVYTLGRVAGWAAQALVVYLVLAFPTGGLATRTDRALAGAMTAVIVVLFLPRLLLAEDFEVPSPYTSCVADCPPNALFAAASEPAFVDGVLRPLGAIAGLVVTFATVLRLRRRRRQARTETRRMLTPVLGVAAIFVGLVGVGLVARLADDGWVGVEVISWLLALTLPALSLAFLLGLLRWRLFAGRALEELAMNLRRWPDAAVIRSAFAKAFDDPSVEIAFPSGNPPTSWSDLRGRNVALPRRGSDRTVTEIHHDGELIAAIIHDSALTADRELLDASSALTGIALDNRRLAAQAETALESMRRSRMRLATSAGEERQRIERDLHDGAQQRLIALRIELGLAEDLVGRDPEAATRQLRRLKHEVEVTLDEIRALAHGVYPPLLADRGLAQALLSATSRAGLRVDFEAEGVERYAPEIESAVYFCVLEAFQNVLKHAHARRVAIRLHGGPEQLRFSVRDDGVGAPGGEARAGAGITNMRDRLAAIGGTVDIVSTPHVGTDVRGSVPTRLPAGAT